MSIGNLKNSGNQGNNFPWQLKMLQGLQAIYDEVKLPLTCVEDSVTICNENIDTFTFTNIPLVGESLNVNIANTIPLEVNINEANDSILIYGFDGAVNRKIKTDANGELQVDILSLPNEGQQTMANSISVALASNQLGIARTTGLLRPTGSGNVNTAATNFFSVSVANVGAADGDILGGTNNIKPGEVLNFSADAINNFFNSFAYDATGTEFIIIFVS